MTQFCRIAWIFLAISAVRARAEGLPEAAEARAKSATVIVKPPKGAAANPGSGFVIRRDSESAVVLTSDWCVGASDTVDLILGAGTPEERVLRGSVLAVDPTRGLATLRVAGVNLPEAIPIAAKTELKETETVYVAGFRGVEKLPMPLPMLELLKANASAFRRNDKSQLIAIQLAGDVAPGQTGGPLLDKAGRAAGLTVGKIEGTQTAFAIPTEEIHAFFAGDWAQITFTGKSVTATRAKVDVSVQVVNPIGTTRSVTLAWGRKDKCKGPKETGLPGKDGEWDKAYAATKETVLRVKDNHAEGTLDIDKTRPDEGRTELLIQFKWSDGGKSRWSAPWTAWTEYKAGEVRVTKSPGKLRFIAAPADPAALEALQPMTTSAAFKESGRLARSSVLSDLHLSPDGSELILLDLSDAKILRVDTVTMTVKAEVSIPPGVAALAVSPDWKSVWTVGQMPVATPNDTYSWVGQARRHELPGLKADEPVELPFLPREVAVTDAGILVLCGNGGDGIVLFDPRKKEAIGRGGSGIHLVLHPSQRYVYYSHGSPWKPGATPIQAVPTDTDPSWTCPASPLASSGEIALSSDGHWLVMASGIAGSISGSREGDFQQKFPLEPALSVAIPRGSSTFFTSTTSGTVREYLLGEFRIRKEVSVGAPLCEMVADAGTKRLYGFAARGEIVNSPGKRLVVVADLVAISLESLR